MTFTEEQVRADLTQAGIPEPMHAGIVRYLVNHVRPGRFLQAVLENDFVAVVMHADEISKPILKRYGGWLYNDLPGRSDSSPWGSAEHVERWIAQGGN